MADQKDKKYIIDNPTLMEEWHWEKNRELGFDPKLLTIGSGKKVWWKCQRGHEWQTHINNRGKGIGCPYCAGKKAIAGKNDLRTVNPVLVSEWNYEKNGDLMPEQFTANSGKKVWWRCQKGHEWQSTIHNRNKRGCPICKSERNTSFPEYAIVYYLKKYGFDVIHSYKEKGYELDVYIPSKKIAIEYDGGYWHKNRLKKDLEKNASCKKDGIIMFRIREGLSALNDSSIDYVVNNNREDLQKALVEILSVIIQGDVDIDLKRDSLNIENLREYTEKGSSLLVAKPELADEWNYERNGKLKPEHCLVNSAKKVWWKCRKGHEWRARIQNRTKGRGCPYCSGRYAVRGETDLQTVDSALAKEWNYKKNNGLQPSDILPNCSKKVWWICQKGHEWQATANSRTRGNGCPYCSGKKAIKGKTDLQTMYPHIASEWDYERNGDLTPADVLPSSNKKVWWKCQKKHEWQAIIGNRIKGHGCPYCAGQKTIKGYNDLQTVNPTLAQEWNYVRNNFTPADVMQYSDKKVWWKCSKGHEWQAVVKSRTKGHGCPYCSGRFAIKGETDLQTVNPRLASEWNYEKNNGLTPTDVLPNSNKKVWWKCRVGHEWQATINNRNQGRGCAVCSGRRKQKN